MIKSLRDFLCWAEKLFIANKLYFGHGTETAWDEAVFIASYVLDLDLYKESLEDRLLTNKQLTKLQKIALARIEHKQPLAYIIKTAWFAGKKYYVNKNVIIPRSPIAELINNKFKPWFTSSPSRVLDLCTGSGCIAIAIFHALIAENPQISIDASDICSKALKIAKKNLELHNVLNKINLIKSDLFNNISNDNNHKYDLIISNPPYVDQKTFDRLPKEFYFEPKKALLAGITGLELVIKILNNANQFLSENGILIVEVGVNWKKLAKLYPKINFMWLEFNNGGEGVFLLTKQQLVRIRFI
jgi:ribosomal protein L3 glutamine methyltransferase